MGFIYLTFAGRLQSISRIDRTYECYSNIPKSDWNQGSMGYGRTRFLEAALISANRLP